MVLLAGKGLWVATATLVGKGDLASLSIERFDLRLERLSTCFSESYPRDSATPYSKWRFTLEDGTELTFQGSTRDDSGIAFGSELAKALDSRPSGGFDDNGL